MSKATNDKEFELFLERLNVSKSPANQNLLQAIVLLTHGFQACIKYDVNDPKRDTDSIAEAANNVSNSYMCDHRALHCVQRHVLRSPDELFSYMQLMVSDGVPHECFSHTILQIATLEAAKQLTPEDSIENLSTLLENMSSLSTTQNSDKAQILIFMSKSYALMGKWKKAIGCLEKAATSSNGTLTGDKALFLFCKITGEGTVKVLKYLHEEMHEENPDFLDVCSMLLDALITISNSNECSDEEKEILDQEIKMIQHSKEKSFQCIKKIYGPYLNDFQSLDQYPPYVNQLKEEKEQKVQEVQTVQKVQKIQESIKVKTRTAATVTSTSDQRKFNECATCGKTNANKVTLKQCSKCGMVQYCSRECQITGWKKGNHKITCEQNVKQFPHPLPDQTIVFGRYRKYIKNALLNEHFIKWWSVDLSLKNRIKICKSVMEDIPENENDIHLHFQNSNTFQNIFPELNIKTMCSFNCKCGSCNLHGNNSSMLFYLMYVRSSCHNMVKEKDRILIESLYSNTDLLDESGIEVMVHSKEETMLHVLVKFIEEWMITSHVVQHVHKHPNLTLRGVGCGLCGKESFCDSMIGKEVNERMHENRCLECCTFFWCSDECRLRGTFLHKKTCDGEKRDHHLLRLNCMDCELALSK
jgi:hypothetical protein